MGKARSMFGLNEERWKAWALEDWREVLYLSG
jgi:hypothetical protein